jgi:hypothetical protein
MPGEVVTVVGRQPGERRQLVQWARRSLPRESSTLVGRRGRRLVVTPDAVYRIADFPERKRP